MQEDPAVEIELVPANSNEMGLHITSNCCVQCPCSAKLYALRTGRHGGQREQRLSRSSLTKTDNLLRGRSARVRLVKHTHLRLGMPSTLSLIHI